MLRRHRYYKPKPRNQSGQQGSRARKSAHPKPTDHRRITGTARTIVGVCFFSAVFAWLAYFFLFSNSFRIKTVVFSGNRNIPKSELRNIVGQALREKRFLVFPGDNIILVSEENIVAAITEQYIVDAVDIARDWPFTLEVSLQEKLSRVILRVKTPVEIIRGPQEETEDTENETATSTLEDVSHNIEAEEEPEREVEYTESYHMLDVNGIVVGSGPVSELEAQELPIIEIIRTGQFQIKPGDSVLSREIVELIFSLYERIRESPKSISLTYVSYDPQVPRELVFATQEGWKAFMSTQIPLETQIQKLELALQEKIQDTRDTLQYVDLRVKDRVYFK